MGFILPKIWIYFWRFILLFNLSTTLVTANTINKEVVPDYYLIDENEEINELYYYQDAKDGRFLYNISLKQNYSETYFNVNSFYLIPIS